MRDAPILDEVLAFAFFAEAVIFERDHRRDRKTIVDLGEAHVFGPSARPFDKPSPKIFYRREWSASARREGSKCGWCCPMPKNRNRPSWENPARARRWSRDTAPPPSDSREQSSKRSGATIMRDCLVIFDGDGFAQRGVLVEARVFARRDRDMGEVLARGAELVHVALRRKGVTAGRREVAPRLLPMLVAAPDRMTGRRIGSRALARMDAHDGASPCRLRWPSRHVGPWRSASRRRAQGRWRTADRCPPYARALYRVAPVRVVERLVG